MTAPLTEILSELVRLDITIMRDADRLRLSPRRAITAEIVEQVREHKSELLEIGFARGPLETFGKVNDGWAPAAWATRLRQLAGLCERFHADRAAYLRSWADVIEEKQSPDSSPVKARGGGGASVPPVPAGRRPAPAAGGIAAGDYA